MIATCALRMSASWKNAAARPAHGTGNECITD
jgi:hypothetical protein